MTSVRQIPTALSVVAYLFLFTAALSVIDIGVSASRGHVHPNCGFLGLWICAGLRRHSRGWRTCALVFTWLGLISYGVMFAIISCAMIINVEQLIQAPPFDFGDIKRVEGSLIWPWMLYAPLFVLQICQYRILRRSDIRSLFYGESRISA
jgi:hypothetical protein